MFVGSQFPATDFTCEVHYAQATSDTCTIDSDTVTATFTLGVGVQEADIAPKLRFINSDETFAHIALPADSVTFTNPLTITGASSALTSSF